MRALVWFRRDLRVLDNPALYHAAQSATEGVIGVFLLTPEQWRRHDDSHAKIKFWLENLKTLSDSLGRLNIPLLVESCDLFQHAPSALLALARRYRCNSIYFNHEYEVHEQRRDLDVEGQAIAAGLKTYSFDDRTVVPPHKILTRQGKFYTVFTPYRRVWEKAAMDYLTVLPQLSKQHPVDVTPTRIPDVLKGFDFSSYRHDLWNPGETEAAGRLNQFAQRITAYDRQRDLPAVNGTSQLSPYLAAGVISARQCLSLALRCNRGRIDGKAGASVWISELAWRDFYTHVLVGFPRVSRHRPFKQNTDLIAWRNDQGDFRAWQAGQTGYPIVDAGMRQLNRTGWMHNRLRMVTAMFLTKHLMIDWRLGERYFMQQLIDGDLAANNGGWQWSASTGTDAVPYFRIFNPFSQSKRFDPQGTYIKTFCPELSPLPHPSLHDAAKLEQDRRKMASDYPAAIIEHRFARERVLNEFQDLKNRH